MSSSQIASTCSMNSERQEVSTLVSGRTWVWAAFSRLPHAGLRRSYQAALRRSWNRLWNSSLRSAWALHAWWWFGPAAAAAAAVITLTG
jgi:hypothetical protein